MPLVALLIFAGELGLPTGIPAEVALLLAGAYAVHSSPTLVASVLLVALADLAGTTLLHLAVRTGGVRLLDRFARHHHAGRETTVARWRRRLSAHDAVLVVFVVRLLPLARMYAAIGTGLLRIRLRSFVLGAAPAALVWAGTPLVLGYLFRARVHGWEARYATASHLLLAAMPAVGLVTGTAWWVHRAKSRRSVLLRARSVVGLAAAAAAAAAGYLVRLIWANDWAVANGSGNLPRPLLALWISALAVLAAVLVGFAYVDLRTTIRPHPTRLHRPALAEVTATIAWALAVAMAAAIPVVIESRLSAL